MRLAWVALLVVGGLVGGAGAATAQSESTPAPPSPSAPVEQSSSPAQVFQSLKDFGSFGASAGLMRFTSDSDASKDAKTRPSLQTSFRYRFSDNWVGVGDFGFGWNAYKDKGDTVLTVMSGTVGLFRHLATPLGLECRLGGGVGFYRWNYKIHGKSIRDPATELFYRAIDPGVFIGLEGERRVTRHVTMTGTTQMHFLFSENTTDFPTAFGKNDSFITARLGLNYHFSPYEGILWEKKIKRTITLTSGKASS